MTLADLFLKITEAIPGTLNAFKPLALECGNTLIRNPLEMVRILFENPVLKCRGKNILLVCDCYPHPGEWVDYE